MVVQNIQCTTPSPTFPTQIVSLLKHCRVFPPKIPCLLSPPLNRYLASPSSRYTPPETSMHPYRPRRAYYYFCGAVSPNHGLVELQFRDWPSAQVRRVLQRTMGCFDLQVCLRTDFSRMLLCKSELRRARRRDGNFIRSTLNRGEVGTLGQHAWYDFRRIFVLWETSRQNASPNAFKFTIRQQRLRW